MELELTKKEKEAILDGLKSVLKKTEDIKDKDAIKKAYEYLCSIFQYG